MMQRVFILSPAKTTGKRAQVLFREQAAGAMAERLRDGGEAAIGEVFAFLSSLYFRGKLAYAQRFARPPANIEGCQVITSDAGLLSCRSMVTLARLQQLSATPIDPCDDRYRVPLDETATALSESLAPSAEVVLLGSIATDKYVGILHQAFGDRLVFPREFIGRGDMSRGGLLLRSAAAGMELEYLAVSAAETRTGKRPPKL